MMKVGDKVSIRDRKSDLFNKYGGVIGFEEPNHQAGVKAIVMVEHYVFKNRRPFKKCIVDRLILTSCRRYIKIERRLKENDYCRGNSEVSTF